MKYIILALALTTLFGCKKKEDDTPTPVKMWKYFKFYQSEIKVMADTGYSETVLTISGYDGTVASNRLPKLKLYSVDHQFAPDMDLYLVSPNGATVLLVAGDSAVTSYGFTNTRFLDGKPSIYTSTHISATGEYSPHESFNAFVGSPVNGEWKLRAYDDHTFSIGEFGGWELELYAGK